MAKSSAIRLSDSERDHLVAHLREALAEGRLSMEEFHARLDAAYAARTYGDAAKLTADLPAALPSPSSVMRRRKRELRHRRAIVNYLGVNGICWGVWGVTVITSDGHIGVIWPLWVTVPWGAALALRIARWRTTP